LLPVYGGAAVGTISHELVGTTGYECGVMLFGDDLPPPAVFQQPIALTDNGERIAGEALGRVLREQTGPGQSVVLFYDSIKAPPSPVPQLHVASHLLDGIDAALDGHTLQIVGIGTLQFFSLTESYIFDGEKTTYHQAVALVLPVEIEIVYRIMHGTTPASDFLEISRIDGATVYELDGRPAVGVLADRLDRSPEALLGRELSMLITLGHKVGDPYAPFDERQYVNRLVISSDQASGSITLFEADFEKGQHVQIMATDAEQMADSVTYGTRQLLDETRGRHVLGALYFDCAARSSAFHGNEREEARILVEQLPDTLPVLGCYSGVEIAPFHGRARPLDWTGVLAMLTVRT
jgi:hypothetical protein